MEKQRARLNILNYVTKFCLSRRYGENGPNQGGFDNDYFASVDYPKIGDLVALSSAPITEWYLSWYVGYEPKGDYFSDVHVLESIDTGKLCSWSNVGFYHLCRSVVDLHPEWKWSDKQYAFKDKWFRACYKKRDAYMTLPIDPIFHGCGGVTIGTRKRFQLGSTYKIKFPNWKKVSVKDMLNFYDQTEWDY